jgi:glucose 1-dehydrogenase
VSRASSNGLAGRNVLVTGASSGIGQAIAVRFGQEGANVAINYRSDAAEARETEREIDAAVEQCHARLRDCAVRTALVRADVSNANDVARMVRETVDALGGLDVLVNNAGIQVDSPTEDLDVDDFDRVVAVNLRGAFLCAREAIRHWLAEGRAGVIVNVSSVHEVIPKPRFAGYSVSKGGLGNLTRTLALEFAGRGIRVNGIGPGATVTPMNAGWIDDAEKRAEVERHIPMGRAGTAEEMAAVVAFLCSDDAAYITGQTLYVDGGLTLYPDFRTAWSSE